MPAQLNYQQAAIDANTVGNNTIVAADASNKINVHAFVLSVDGATADLRFEDGAAGTALTGVMEVNVGTSLVVPFSEVPWFSASVNTLLNLEVTNTSAAANGFIIYSLTK